MNPREKIKMLFFNLLKEESRIEMPKKVAALLEQSCFNTVIETAEKSDIPLNKTWESDQFINLYSARCAILLNNLNPKSNTSKIFGNSILESLISKKVSPTEIGSWTDSQLCPMASQNERQEIELRNSQILKEKASKLYKCPNCKIRECAYYEIQARVLDEPTTIFCKCLQCGFIFRG